MTPEFKRTLAKKRKASERHIRMISATVPMGVSGKPRSNRVTRAVLSSSWGRWNTATHSSAYSARSHQMGKSVRKK